jgi:glycosyltransferase involved in cell wall biosynthesis
VSAASFEPFGLAVLEAAQAGCPLVLSDIPTFRELWDGAALFVAPDSEIDVAQAIESLIADPALRAQLGAAAVERAALYTPAAMAEGMLGIYDRVLLHERAA